MGSEVTTLRCHRAVWAYQDRSGSYARAVAPQIIDGEGWIAERLKFLRERLAAPELPADERTAIETEIETLSKEGGIGPGGWRFPRPLRRLRRKR